MIRFQSRTASRLNTSIKKSLLRAEQNEIPVDSTDNNSALIQIISNNHYVNNSSMRPEVCVCDVCVCVCVCVCVWGGGGGGAPRVMA